MASQSRAPGGFGISDVRSVAVLQDHLFSTDPCIPGAHIMGKCGRTYLADCGEPPCGFDRPKYMISGMMAMCVVGCVLGNLNCVGLYIDSLQKAYNVGFIEVAITAALTYAIFIKSGAIGCCMMACWGHKEVALFGMILFFLGILLDALTINFAAFYVIYYLFYGIGGGLAYSSAMSLGGDLFRQKLMVALLCLSCGGCIGTVFFYWIHAFLIGNLTYRWTKIVLAILVIIFTGITHLFPNFRVDTECGLEQNYKEEHGMVQGSRNTQIKKCVNDAVKRDEESHRRKIEQKSMMCVCVCDISVLADWSFVLWGAVVLIATMALYLPYMYLLAFADSKGIPLSLWYIPILCLASCGGRAFALTSVDFTYDYNRNQLVMIVAASGMLWIVLPYTESFGWLLIWSILMGICEAFIVCTVPRMTLSTLPLKWIEIAWPYILWFHAIGVMCATIFVAVLSAQLNDFYMAFIIIGVIQLVGAFLSILLPNEQGCDPNKNADDDCEEGLMSKVKSLFRGNDNKYNGDTLTRSTRFSPRSATIVGMGTYRSGRSRSRRNRTSDHDHKFDSDCPICAAIGCIPECDDCGPSPGAKDATPTTPEGETPGKDEGNDNGVPSSASIVPGSDKPKPSREPSSALRSPDSRSGAPDPKKVQDPKEPSDSDQTSSQTTSPSSSAPVPPSSKANIVPVMKTTSSPPTATAQSKTENIPSVKTSQASPKPSPGTSPSTLKTAPASEVPSNKPSKVATPATPEKEKGKHPKPIESKSPSRTPFVPTQSFLAPSPLLDKDLHPVKHEVKPSAESSKTSTTNAPSIHESTPTPTPTQGKTKLPSLEVLPPHRLLNNNLILQDLV